MPSLSGVAKLLGGFGGWQGYAAVAVLGGALAGFASWYVTDKFSDLAIAGIQHDFDEYKHEADEKRLAAWSEADDRYKLLQEAMDRAAANYERQLQDALDANKTLRGAFLNGTRVLRINAFCPAGWLPGTKNPDPAAGSYATSVRLTQESGLAVFNIREGMIQDRQTLDVCQASLRALHPVSVPAAAGST